MDESGESLRRTEGRRAARRLPSSLAAVRGALEAHGCPSVSVIERLRWHVSTLTMTASQRYEAASERFHKETGFLAPGRSVPAAMNKGDDYDIERGRAWREWGAADAKLFREDLVNVLRLADYAKHKPGCKHDHCATCGFVHDTLSHAGIGDNAHAFVAKACSCGLADIIGGSRVVPVSRLPVVEGEPQ